MQTTESKTTTPSLQLKTAQSPFFQQERSSQPMERSSAPFFSTGGTQQSFFTKPTIQTKLTVGQPGDKYEQEADQVADQVVQRLAEHNTTPNPHIIQPKCATCQEEEKLQQKEKPGEEEKLQRKPIFESNTERPELPVQAKFEAPSFLQKKCTECAAEDETPSVQRAVESTGTPSAASSLESRLSSSRGGGSPLPVNTRTQMEGAFGSDFSGVRVHTGISAIQMNQELSAQAFTHGSDVYFNAGKYDGGSTEGQRLLGHELTHVVQQGEMTQLVQRTPNDEGAASQRLILLDGSVLNEIMRGNTQVATALRTALGNAQVMISLQAYNELLATPVIQTRVAYQRLLTDLNIQVAHSGGSIDERLAVYTADASRVVGGQPRPLMSETDILVAAQARGLQAEVWGTDRVFRRNWREVEQVSGVRVAPESYTINLVHGAPLNYIQARQLLGLDEIEIAADGTVRPMPHVTGIDSVSMSLFGIPRDNDSSLSPHSSVPTLDAAQVGSETENERLFQYIQANPEILNELPNQGFLERPLIRISPEQTSYIVRTGGPHGQYAYHIFNSVEEARSYAVWVAAHGAHWMAETTALPRRWPGSDRDNPVISRLTIYEIPPNTIYLQGVIASQPESHPDIAHTYPGGGPQIEFPRQTSGLVPVEDIPVHANGSTPPSASLGAGSPPVPPVVSPTSSTLPPEAEDPFTRTSSLRPTGDLSSEGRLSVGAHHSQETIFSGAEAGDSPIYNATQTNGGGLTYQQDEHGHNIGAEVSHRRREQIGDSPASSSSISASGHLHINDEGHVDGGGGNLSIGANQTTVTVGGSVRITAQRPILVNGAYVVSWENSARGSAGLGYERGAVGGSLSYTRSSGITGQRVFLTQEEAMAFYESRAWAQISLDDTTQLAEGETVAQSSGNQLDLGGTINLEGVTVGANISIGGNHSIEVTGLAQHRISVRITDDFVLGGSASIGAPGVGMSGGLQRTTTTGQIVNFDLGTAEGRDAFNYLRIFGRLPATGFTLTANILGQSDTESTGITLGVASATETNTTSETTLTDNEGNPIEEQRSGTEAINIRIPLVGNFSEAHQIASREDVRTGERTYSASTTISSSSTESVNHALAESTGHHWGTGSQLENQSSRRWEVTSTFTEPQIRLLMQAMRQGDFNYHSLIYQAGHGEDFMHAVRRAGANLDEVERALSEFISETGSRGLLLIRQTIHAQPAYDLRLIGDEYMTGAEGHARLAERIAAFGTRFASGSNLHALGSEISIELSTQQSRLTAILNPERYPDLPHELRQREVERSRAEIGELSGLRDRALAAVRGSSHEAATESPQSSQTITTSAWSSIMEQESQVQASRQGTVERGNEARRHHWIQVEGAYAFSRRAIETYGAEAGWFSDAREHHIDYIVAQRFLNTANRTWEQAETAWTNYSRQKGQLEFGTNLRPEAIQNLRSRLENCLQFFNSARQQFHAASIIYQDILTRHLSEGRHNEFQAYTQERQLPSDRRLI